MTKSTNKKAKSVQDADIIRINERIQKEICNNTISELTDDKLLPVYKTSKSLIESLKKQEQMLDKYVDNETKQKILNDPDNILQLIQPGTKGVVRGNKFNEIIKKTILDLNLNTEKFEVCFEKDCLITEYKTSEKPDWYILEKSTNNIIIGMNQLDLWSGGAQSNRGSKYIDDKKFNNEKCKLLCVVCNDVQITSKKNKIYKLFENGFRNNTLCYLNNLQNMIITHFTKNSSL